MSNGKNFNSIDITPAITGNFSQFKEFIEPFDLNEEKKSLIYIRQAIKQHPDTKWRSKKVKYIKIIIKSLEFTKKSRGAKPSQHVSDRLDDIDLRR